MMNLLFVAFLVLSATSSWALSLSGKEFGVYSQSCAGGLVRETPYERVYFVDNEQMFYVQRNIDSEDLKCITSFLYVRRASATKKKSESGVLVPAFKKQACLKRVDGKFEGKPSEGGSEQFVSNEVRYSIKKTGGNKLVLTMTDSPFCPEGDLVFQLVRDGDKFLVR